MLEIKAAVELVDPVLEARWASRRAARLDEVFQCVLRTFVTQGGPIRLEQILRALPTRPARAVREALATLDRRDLILWSEEQVVLAYPFSAAPTPFAVVLSNRQVRYAVCAVDALGIAAMLDEDVRIRSRCHHCSERLEFSAGPTGPHPDAAAVMVWIGSWGEAAGRIATSL